MMSPQAYADARDRASIHVQLLRGGVRAQREAQGSVSIHGWVVRIFRDRERVVHLGQRVSFAVPIRGREREPIPSGEIIHDWGYLGRARFVEAFLEKWEGEFQLVHGQVIGIRHPTLRPVCPPGAEGFLCQGTRR